MSLLGQIGPLAATKRPNINPKCVVTISLLVKPTQTNWWQLGPNLALWGPPMTSGVSKRGILGQNGPFWGPRRGPIPGQSV